MPELEQSNDLSAISRSIHVTLVLLAPSLGNWVKSSPAVVIQTSYLFLACMPIIWMTGILPPSELLLLWLAEQAGFISIQLNPLILSQP